jgi:hypothetical protein
MADQPSPFEYGDLIYVRIYHYELPLREYAPLIKLESMISPHAALGDRLPGITRDDD